MKARVSSIFLLTIIIVPAVSTYLWLNHQRSEVKHEVKRMMIRGIDRDELILLKFSKEEAETKLKWEHSKEFEYNQQMYDVVESKIIGDTIYYWSWLDNEETRLNQELAELVTNLLNTDPQKKETENQLISFYKSLYYSENSSSILHPFAIKQKQRSFYQLSFNSITFPPLTPPPR